MKLRFTIASVVVTAFVLSGVGVPASKDVSLTSKVWAGGGHHDDDNDDEGRDRPLKLKKKELDHFACYTAASHQVGRDVKIVNQFTRDEEGNIVALPITVGELALLCVPTKKILIDE